MMILLNGTPYEGPTGSLVALLQAQQINLDQRGLAVAVNGAVVNKRLWAETAVKEGDRVEVVRAVVGG